MLSFCLQTSDETALLSFPVLHCQVCGPPLPSRYWTLASQTLGPQPPFRDPALCFPFYFSVSCAPLRRPCGEGVSPVPPWPPTLTVYTHLGPTVTFLHQLPLQSADSRAQTCSLGLHITVRHPCAPRLSGSINSHHSGPIETLFLRSQIQAISKHCRLLILLFLAPCPPLSYC